MTIELAPSILSANFAWLADDAKAALEGGGTVLHLDVMDGHFVPNITIGPPVVASLRKALPDTVFDCHLMIENPDSYIPARAHAGRSAGDGASRSGDERESGLWRADLHPWVAQ